MNAASEHRITFATAEGVSFTRTLAGPTRRAIALGIDVGIVASLTSLVNGVFAAFRWISPDLALFLSLIGSFVIAIGYGVFFEWLRRGRTLGKQVMDLRVIDSEGRRLEFHQVLIRNLLRAIDGLPGLYLVGAISMACTRHGQRLGDLAAGTLVIVEQSPGVPNPRLDTTPGRHNSLMDHPRLAKLLRQALTPEEFRIACAALSRRDQMEPSARLELFRELAERLRKLVPFPPEVLEGVGDEKLVGNVIEVVCQGR
jgi:uncharacterized RDD family membrane protein YckC